MKDESEKKAYEQGLQAGYLKGLERAIELMRHARFYVKGITAIKAEIDKTKTSR